MKRKTGNLWSSARVVLPMEKQVVDGTTRRTTKCKNRKIARAKRAKQLCFIVKYANFANDVLPAVFIGVTETTVTGGTSPDFAIKFFFTLILSLNTDEGTFPKLFEILTSLDDFAQYQHPQG